MSKKSRVPISFFNEQVELEGDLYLKGDLHLNGKFKGQIHSDATVSINKKAAFKGQILVQSIVISGEVKGEVVAQEKIELKKNGRLEGTITSSNLIIDKKSFFSGQSTLLHTKKIEKPTNPKTQTKEPFTE